MGNHLVDLCGAAAGSCIEQLCGAFLLLPGQQRLCGPPDPGNVCSRGGWRHINAAAAAIGFPSTCRPSQYCNLLIPAMSAAVEVRGTSMLLLLLPFPFPSPAGHPNMHNLLTLAMSAVVEVRGTSALLLLLLLLCYVLMC